VHSGTDIGKRAFGGDDTHRQHGWGGKDGEQERQRGEKAADASCLDTDTAAASNSTTASDRARLQTRAGGVGVRGEASGRRRTAAVTALGQWRVRIAGPVGDAFKARHTRGERCHDSAPGG
jgi:hypothetical protein